MNNITSTVSKSNIMRAYNAAKKSNCFEIGRLNRALGIVQSNSTKLLSDGRLDVNVNDWHMATIKQCDCIDSKKVKYCKHKIAKMLVVKAQQLSKETK